MPEQFDPVDYYDEYGADEWERLERNLYGRLEFEETVQVLERYLPSVTDPDDPPAVYDVGGGAGRYTVWLAERGYDVTMVDPSAEQRALARETVRDRDLDGAVEVRDGDARDLAAADGAADATLCLGGPVSHLLDETDRRRAVAELRRVTAPGGPVVVSVMGLLAALQTVARMGGRVDPKEDETELLPRLARTGDYDADLLEAFDREPNGPPMHLFRVDELESLLSDAGLDVAYVTGLESVTSQRRRHFDELTETHRTALRETVAELRGDRGVADCSGHMLAVARTPDEQASG